LQQGGGHHSGFVDDVRLRADVVTAWHTGTSGLAGGECWTLREESDVQEEEGAKHSQPQACRSKRSGDSPDGDDVIRDLSNLLHGNPSERSILGHSLDESMMGGIDESFGKDGFSIPGLPEPKLGECLRAEVPATAQRIPPQKFPQTEVPATEVLEKPHPELPQPQRTVFFPAPPVSAASRVYHKGHYQGWSQRTPRSLSPPQIHV
jgi:hypothetical protein